MKLNGINQVSYSQREDGASFVLECTVAQAAALDGQVLVMTDARDNEYARFEGMHAVGAVTTANGYVQLTVARALDPDTASAIHALEANVATVRSMAENADEVAGAAKSTADEAKELAGQGGGNPQVAAFATMQIQKLAPTLSDSRIAEVCTLLPDFVDEGCEYKKGECFKYDGRTWRVSSDHTSQAQWKPGGVGTESLYYEIVIAPDGVIVWAQPRGEFDAPDNGDLRHYPDADGPVYRSLVDDNAYSPDAYPDNWEQAE